MNHFLALRPDYATRDRLGVISERLQAWDLPAHWVHPDDFHLTVLFLGALTTDDAQWLPTMLDEVARALIRPTLSLAGLGAIGTKGREETAVPHRVFAAITDASQFCRHLHLVLAECAESEPSSDFAPHVTLCRPLAQPTNGQLFRDWPHLLEANGLANWGACNVDALCLYRSGGGVPRYETLESWPLA